MTETKNSITSGFETSVEKLPQPIKEKATQTFTDNQKEYSTKIVDAFSSSLQRIFLVSSLLMLVAGVLVFSLKEKPLKTGNPNATPSEA